MMHHRLAVGADLQVGLDPVATRNGRGCGGRCVLDYSLCRIVEPAMGDRASGQPSEG
jgi:hypothetical protein